METLNFKSPYSIDNTFQKEGGVRWRSPSNLAIVKYWGKYGQQLPKNPSLSITLSKAISDTAISYTIDGSIERPSLEFLFEEKKNSHFQQRIERYLSSISEYLPFLNKVHLKITSKNSFPHSSGIASSASAMSALSLCLCDIEKSILKSLDIDISDTDFHRKASFIARLGSGSACRSIYSNFALWGKTKSNPESSDLYAVQQNNVHGIFQNLRNDIIIVSKEKKSVSSSDGHKLMDSNPYASNRYDQAYKRTENLISILNHGDITSFGEMLESEAMVLHALMMASSPSYILMEPNTLKVLKLIRAFRMETKTPVFFSLDAGPNVHLIYLDRDKEIIAHLIQEVKQYSVANTIISDCIGKGPVKVV